MFLLFAFIEPLNDIEAQADKDDSLLDDVVSQFSPKCTGTASVSPDENQNTSMAMIHSCSEDTKL